MRSDLVELTKFNHVLDEIYEHWVYFFYVIEQNLNVTNEE